MALEIASEGGRYGMRAHCDYCGIEVTDGDCNVLSDRLIADSGSVAVKIACKSPCTWKLDPERKMANQELGRCIFHLVNNAKIDIDRERERDASLWDL